MAGDLFGFALHLHSFGFVLLGLPSNSSKGVVLPEHLVVVLVVRAGLFGGRQGGLDGFVKK